MTGLLDGVRVLEFDAIGPAPFCGMLLADHGASVLRVVRPVGQPNGVDAGDRDVLLRGRPSLVLDLKTPAGVARALELVAESDVLIEGYRPGAMERLGLGPDACLARRPGLVYGRVTGFGQSGPLAHAPGHDINFIAVNGVLHALGEPDRPPRPALSMLGDFGGGGMLLAFGVLAALLAVRRGGPGGVLDAAMTEGSALLMAMTHGWRNAGAWSAARGANLVDGGAPFYRCYATRDGRFVAVGALEPKFQSALYRLLGLDADPRFRSPDDRAQWPAMTEAMAEAFRQRTRDEWAALAEGGDACLSPVLSMDEAPRHPQLASRAAFRGVPGGVEPQAAPRWTREEPCRVR